MKKLAMFLAATTMLAVPAIAQPNGNAYGHDPRVCLITFESEAVLGTDAGVVKAQYLPLRIAQRHELRNSALADLYVYGTDGPVEGAIHVASPSDPALGITPDMDTEEVCEILGDFADSRDDDDDED